MLVDDGIKLTLNISRLDDKFYLNLAE